MRIRSVDKTTFRAGIEFKDDSSKESFYKQTAPQELGFPHKKAEKVTKALQEIGEMLPDETIILSEKKDAFTQASKLPAYISTLKKNNVIIAETYYNFWDFTDSGSWRGLIIKTAENLKKYLQINDTLTKMIRK